MNPLQEGRRSLILYCQNILLLLDQSLDVLYRAGAAGQEEEKDEALQQMKKYSLQLFLLVPFYRLNEAKTQAQKLQKLCVLLAQENLQAESVEVLHLLTSFYSTLAELANFD